MAFSTTCPVAGARLVSSKKVSAPRRAAVQVTDLKLFLPLATGPAAVFADHAEAGCCWKYSAWLQRRSMRQRIVLVSR